MSDAQRLMKVVELAEAGRLDEAVGLCEALNAEDASAPGLTLLATLRRQQGDLAQAEEIYLQAIASFPKEYKAYQGLASLYLANDRAEEAERRCREALALRPDGYGLYLELARICARLGKVDAMRQSYAQARRLRPELPAAYQEHAAYWQSRGEFLQAKQVLEEGLRAIPESAALLYALGQVYYHLNDQVQAIDLFQRCLALQGESPEVLTDLGVVFEARQMPGKAIEAYRRALAVDPNYARAHLRLPYPLLELGRPVEARQHFERMLALHPEDGELHMVKGLVLKAMGDMEGARESLQRAVDLKPQNAAAYLHLVKIGKYGALDAYAEKMMDLVERPGYPPEEAMIARFALGKLHEDIGLYDRAFGYFREANRRHRDLYPHRSDADLHLMDALIAAIDGRTVAAFAGTGNESRRPIFVVGMPRSGTTLTEQVLAAHPQVFGAGELPDLPQLLQAQLYERREDRSFLDNIKEFLTPETLAAVAERYLAGLEDRAAGVPYVVDKLPHNFLQVGLIRLMFPRAAIIHCTRHPVSNCWSLYKNVFKHGHFYCYDLQALGRYYCAYRRLMAHWRRLFPQGFFDSSYEVLVRDQEPQTRALLQHCGLPWDEGCLQFHARDGVVMTASQAQVRQPMYRQSVRLWEHYETHLAPLVEALDRCGAVQ